MRWIFILFLLVSGGCAENIPVKSDSGPDVLFISPGVGGSGGYAGLARAVTHPGQSAFVIGWGAPIFVMNFSDESIHNDAEEQLASEIRAWHSAHPNGRIDLIGHSAGCGVVLGALAQLQNIHAHNVVLLAPSVSPGYDLNPALAHINGRLHVFYSARDGLLEWRTSTFESYDRVKGAAAGVGGFKGNYPPDKLLQHAYRPEWADMGYDGGHWGPIAEPFDRQIVAPLLAQ
ncbi:MAG TPA: alpha/beta hydrolase [Tepidisphaeraceae bacterium]|nr:alpha/beta hydrolase [Tepidisphaeraceae bacterium]